MESNETLVENTVELENTDATIIDSPDVPSNLEETNSQSNALGGVLVGVIIGAAVCLAPKAYHKGKQFLMNCSKKIRDRRDRGDVVEINAEVVDSEEVPKK